MNKIIALCLYLSITVTFVVSCGNGGDNSIKSVNVARASIGELEKKVSAKGKFGTAQKQEIWLDDLSLLDALYVEKGQPVRTGEPILKIKNPSIYSDIVKAEIEIITAEYRLNELSYGKNSPDLSKARRQYEIDDIEYQRSVQESETMSALYSAKAISRSRHEEALTLLKKAEARAEASKEDLEVSVRKQKTDIRLARMELDKSRKMLRELEKQRSDLVKRAEFDGVIAVARKVNKDSSGEKVPVVVLVNPQKYSLDLQINTYDIPNVVPGQRVDVYLEEYKLVISGKIKDIGMEVIKKQATFGGESPNLIEAYATLDGFIPGGIKIGAEVSANILISSINNILLVPIESILEVDGKTYVFSESGGTLRRVSITIGESDGTYVEVKHGLVAGDQVVVSDLNKLKNGDRVIALRIPDKKNMNSPKGDTLSNQAGARPLSESKI